MTNSTAPAAHYVAVPACGCGAPVTRFVVIDGESQLTCNTCFKGLAHSGEVTHHVRTSHGDCLHDATPADRAKCRAARRRGEEFIGDGYDDTIGLLTTKAGNVHAMIDATHTACRPAQKTNGDASHGTADEVTCPACLRKLDDAAA